MSVLGSQEAEEIGRTVLPSQFVAGLRNKIKIKRAGMEGDMDQLLVRARFEEAKRKDLVNTDKSMRTERRLPGVAEQHQWRIQSKFIQPTCPRGSSGAGNSVTLYECLLRLAHLEDADPYHLPVAHCRPTNATMEAPSLRS